MKTLALLLSLTSLAAAAEPPALPADAKLATDLPYVDSAHDRQKLDLAFFKNGPPRPLLIWIHGGAFAVGDKGEIAPIIGELLERGYAVASINYRLSGDAKWPAQITDCKAAVRYLRAHAEEYRLAPDRFGVWGSSAGGHLAALVGASGEARKLDVGGNLDQSSAVQCVIDMFGPIDFEQMPLRTDPHSPEARMFGKSTAEAPELAREACPITYLSKKTPPLLVFHGDADTVVSIDQSRLFHDALEKAGVPNEFITLPGVGHSHVDIWTRERERILGFFAKHLKVSRPVTPAQR